ncbi:hypothetical protein SS1G_03425 [Sclerotinia sclerotiorum 1980 UF-70]|uniref:Uncharacterized protein n=1 Tax=Sclerotinia sclerotiorum (strain ATCC 18683 / 1980 / Ss-1) TaxID=665079 RepID=A7EDN5_SCLS1|nr:hypothetical protein SS1G_03425 [Sclerotinia sclerotiorum 1980 UF-70]EDO00951.1 hypothetical protein SS1G_03425 [Sclerotinia sclerotiorum 1980 UF-70]
MNQSEEKPPGQKVSKVSRVSYSSDVILAIVPMPDNKMPDKM